MVDSAWPATHNPTWVRFCSVREFGRGTCVAIETQHVESTISGSVVLLRFSSIQCDPDPCILRRCQGYFYPHLPCSLFVFCAGSQICRIPFILHCHKLSTDYLDATSAKVGLCEWPTVVPLHFLVLLHPVAWHFCWPKSVERKCQLEGKTGKEKYGAWSRLFSTPCVLWCCRASGWVIELHGRLVAAQWFLVVRRDRKIRREISLAVFCSWRSRSDLPAICYFGGTRAGHEGGDVGLRPEPCESGAFACPLPKSFEGKLFFDWCPRTSKRWKLCTSTTFTTFTSTSAWLSMRPPHEPQEPLQPLQPQEQLQQLESREPDVWRCGPANLVRRRHLGHFSL